MQQDLRALLELKVRKVLLALRVTQAHKVLLVPKVILALRGQQVPKARRDQLDLLAHRVQLVPKVLKGLKEQLGFLLVFIIIRQKLALQVATLGLVT